MVSMVFQLFDERFHLDVSHREAVFEVNADSSNKKAFRVASPKDNRWVVRIAISIA
jgi:hypothetical protein